MPKATNKIQNAPVSGHDQIGRDPFMPSKPAESAARRSILAGIVAALAYPAVAGAHDVQAVEGVDPQERIASVEDYAAMRFEAWGPELKTALGQIDEWLQQARADYLLWQFVAGAMQKDDVQTLEAVQECGPDALQDLVERFASLRNWHESSAKILLGAELRTIAGLSQYALVTGEAGA